jgi:hypothetical protein
MVNVTEPPPLRGGFNLPVSGEEGGRGKKKEINANLKDLLTLERRLAKKESRL